MLFQHTAARRRLERTPKLKPCAMPFQHTAARRRLENYAPLHSSSLHVSTHSRPKAAGPAKRKQNNTLSFQHTAARRRLVNRKRRKPKHCCFNTQPPEGGWDLIEVAPLRANLFQHTAARRRLAAAAQALAAAYRVSTHSRPKAAGQGLKTGSRPAIVSTHSRPKAAGKQRELIAKANAVSTHSRPKAAGVLRGEARGRIIVSTHSRPKAAGRSCAAVVRRCLPFQHTAARRRLGVNTKAVGRSGGFNTQPPEGGWFAVILAAFVINVSTHSRPKAAGSPNLHAPAFCGVSTHSRPKAAGFQT